MRMLRPIFVTAIVLLGSCLPALAETLSIDVDRCVAKVEVVISQNGATEKKEFDNPGSAQFTGFDWSKPLSVKITVVEMKPECESTIAKGDTYYLDEVVPTANGQAKLTTANLPNLYRATTVEKLGKVYGGVCKTPQSGPGIALGADLGTASGDCTKTCWEQWIKPTLFWLDGAQEKEIVKGVTAPAAAGGTFTFGEFGRDLPNGSTGNCFREDPIPGRPNAKGIVDAPAYRPADEQKLFARIGLAIRAAGGSPQLPFKVRFRFSVNSVLWCESTTPPTLLGYYQWSGYQDYKFEDNPSPPPFWKGVRGESIIKQSDIKWKAGNAGLPPAQQQH